MKGQGMKSLAGYGVEPHGFNILRQPLQIAQKRRWVNLLLFKKIKTFLFQDNVAAFVCALPFTIGLLAFLIVPMGLSLYYSFTDFRILAPPNWVGLDNYVRMWNDDRFWRSMRATFYFAFTSVPLRVVFALAIALLLLKASKMIAIYRAMYYLPSILGGSVAVAILWGRMFSSDGTVNNLLEVTNLYRITELFGFGRSFNWLGNAQTAIWTLIILAAWQFGSSMLIFLASLKQIPDTLYEASSIDGAGKIRQFFRITLPLITPTIFFNLVMQMINGFLAFTQAFIIFEDGRPVDTTLFFSLYMYMQAFRFFNAGYASAMAWDMLVMIGLMTFVLFATKRFWVYDGGYA